MKLPYGTGGLLALFLLLAPAAARVQEVTPIDEVRSGVLVRELPATGDTPVLGSLRPGDRADVLESVPSWFKIRLASGTEGFVSKRWVRVIAATPVGPSALGVPFRLHMVDVGVGDALILDTGDVEVLIDGGMHATPLREYVAATQVIQDPIELLIVTHADSDHWKGAAELLKLNDPSPAHQVLEFWEPGFDRDCSALDSYVTFISGMQRIVQPARFMRPLQQHHQPAVMTNLVQPFSIVGIPGVLFTVLHAEANPAGPNCAFRINNASIVLRVEVGGVKLLLTGDANGKLRTDNADIVPAHVEGKLLALEAQHPGTLKADVLKVGHHGSETANTNAFIAAVRPRFAIISASTNHHLPDPPVVRLKMLGRWCCGRITRGRRKMIRSCVSGAAVVMWTVISRIRYNSEPLAKRLDGARNHESD